jgi:hypothetical protein
LNVSQSFFSISIRTLSRTTSGPVHISVLIKFSQKFNVSQSFFSSSIRNHLNEHGLSIENYQEMYHTAAEYEVTVRGAIGHAQVRIYFELLRACRIPSIYLGQSNVKILNIKTKPDIFSSRKFGSVIQCRYVNDTVLANFIITIRHPRPSAPDPNLTIEWVSVSLPDAHFTIKSVSGSQIIKC